MDLNLFFKPLTEDLLQYGLDAWEAPIQQRINQVFAEKSHGLLEPWWAAYQALPDASIINTDHSANCVSAVAHSNHSAAEQQQLIDGLLTWMPWRKGPYCIANVHIDTEWRSDMKWQRILPHISLLKGKKVLDVGCGNGYHMWRMLGEGAELVLGVDPSQFFLFQFQALKKYLGPHMPIHLMPFTSEQLYDLSPAIKLAEFDTVFSMGVLYHRASPIDHLKELLAMLKPGGELVLETLIVEEAELLLPDERYAKMRNVWFIPSVELLLQMIKRAGFIEACCVDISVTTVEEQRATEWMTFESLADFLNPDDPSLTIEGYPAPVRAAIRARKKA